MNNTLTVFSKSVFHAHFPDDNNLIETRRFQVMVEHFTKKDCNILNGKVVVRVPMGMRPDLFLNIIRSKYAYIGIKLPPMTIRDKREVADYHVYEFLTPVPGFVKIRSRVEILGPGVYGVERYTKDDPKNKESMGWVPYELNLEMVSIQPHHSNWHIEEYRKVSPLQVVHHVATMEV